MVLRRLGILAFAWRPPIIFAMLSEIVVHLVGMHRGIKASSALYSSDGENTTAKKLPDSILGSRNLRARLYARLLSNVVNVRLYSVQEQRPYEEVKGLDERM